MYIKFLHIQGCGIDYGVPYEVEKIHGGILAGFIEVIDEWGRPHFTHIRNLFSVFVFCDKDGRDL